MNAVNQTTTDVTLLQALCQIIAKFVLAKLLFFYKSSSKGRNVIVYTKWKSAHLAVEIISASKTWKIQSTNITTLQHLK